MEKYISINKETTAKICKIFNICERTVKNALTYRNNSELAKRIRKVAKQNYGVTYVVEKEEFVCFFDSDGLMHQVFPNGAELYFDTIEGEVKLYWRGDIKQRWGNINITDIPELQATARAL